MNDPSHVPSYRRCGRPPLLSVLAVSLPYLGPAAQVFGFVPLPLPLLGAALAIMVLYVVATEVAKLWFYRRRSRVHGSVS